MKQVNLQPLGVVDDQEAEIEFRRGRQMDATACGTVCYEAFAGIAGAHGFPQDFPTADHAIELAGWMLGHPQFYSVVAERNGRIVGSNFLDLRNPIAGVGPITVDPSVQNSAVGRRLMEDVHRCVVEKGLPGVRLVQAAYHGRSLSLYTKLGYVVREPLVCLQGAPLELTSAEGTVRAAHESDLELCNALCTRTHGFDRGGELRDAIGQGTARVVERDGRITGYATSIGFFGHAVGEQTGDLKALIGAAEEFAGPGLLLPARDFELLRWCLAVGLRVVQPMTLMSRGEYREPAGPFLPSILY